MGKNSKYPAYSSGAVSINGQKVASQYKKGNTIHSSYNMTGAEKAAYDYAQNSLQNSLPKIDIFSADTQRDINSQIDAYKNQGVQNINDIYNPIMNNLKTDMASRFGNMNNSIFFDNLNKVEKNRAQAINSLAQDIATQKSNLYNNELNNRYNYINFMNGLQNQLVGNGLSYLGIAQNNAAAGNSYNQAAYTANTAAKQNMQNQFMQDAALAAKLAMYLL